MRHHCIRLVAIMQRQVIRLCSGLGSILLILCQAGCSCCKVFTKSSPSRFTPVSGVTSRRKFYQILCAVVTIFLIAAFWITPRNEIYLPKDINLDDYDAFEPLVTEDFPHVDGVKPKIPKILHQTFQQTSIPPCFQDNIKSLVSNNPDWTYYLWTDETSRKFVEDTHPELLDTFDGYREGIRRADFIRYVVLYELGGLYADLDTMTYRSLNRATTKYTCVFPTEPFEHAALRAFVPYLINNAIMMCQPKHPFLKFILENLPRFEHMFKVLDATGPAFVTTMYMQYNNLSRESATVKPSALASKSVEPYFYKGKLAADDPSAVYIPNSQYFCNTLDTSGIWWFYQTCQDFSKLTLLEKRACVNMKKRGMVRTHTKYAFIEHKFYRTYAWWHFYNYLDIYLYMFSKDIRKLVPHVKFYTGKNDLPIQS